MPAMVDVHLSRSGAEVSPAVISSLGQQGVGNLEEIER